MAQNQIPEDSMNDFEELFFYRPEVVVIPFPETCFNEPYQFDRDQKIPCIEEEVESLKRRMAQCVAYDMVIRRIVGYGVPVRKRIFASRIRPYETPYTYNSEEQYMSFSPSYGTLTVYIDFRETDSLETKDRIIEEILSRCHREFGCSWQRRTERGSSTFTASQFSVLGENISLQIYTSDTLGCAMEVIEEEEPVPEYEAKELKILEDGKVVKAESDYRLKDGKIVKINRKTKMHCSGEVAA